MSAVAAMATCLGAWTLTQMVLEYGLAGRVERAVDIDAMLFVASDKIGLERPVVGDALLGDGPADAAVLAGGGCPQGYRRPAGAGGTSNCGVSYPGAEAQMAVVQQTRADLATWRANVDRR